jgi:hypothetical protein
MLTRFMCAKSDSSSSLSQRHSVVPLIYATNPCATASRRNSVSDQRAKGQAAARRQLTGQRFDLDPDRRGKNAPADRCAADLRDQTAGECRNVAAIC